MLVLSKSEMSRMAPRFAEEQSKRHILDAVAAWLAFKPKWSEGFKPGCTLSLERTYNTARWLFAWSQDHGFTRQAHYITLVVLVLKAVHLGATKRYVRRVLATVEAFGTREEEIEAALIWLDYAIEARVDWDDKP